MSILILYLVLQPWPKKAQKLGGLWYNVVKLTQVFFIDICDTF
jgi:hypothetical protein